MERPHAPLELERVRQSRDQIARLLFICDQFVQDQHHLVVVVARLGQRPGSTGGDHSLCRPAHLPQAPGLDDRQSRLPCGPDNGPGVTGGLHQQLQGLFGASELDQELGLEALQAKLPVSLGGTFHQHAANDLPRFVETVGAITVVAPRPGS